MEELTGRIAELSLDLRDALRLTKDESELRAMMSNHLAEITRLNPSLIQVPDFDRGLEWMNVTEPLSLRQHLIGKIVILDFFTYCCINCMHIIPNLKRLELEFPIEEGLVVIGVHSAKFTNERITENIEAAVLRYNITHPVVNDSKEKMWSNLQIQCWPTLYILGPSSEPLLMLQGEVPYSTLKSFLLEAIPHFGSSLRQQGIPQIRPLARARPRTTSLFFPGKLSVSPDGSALAVSDTCNHRILVVSTNSRQIQWEIGGGCGFSDGDFDTAKFNSPQGVTMTQDQIYVADTENHSIRKICLKSKRVTTLVGNGLQGNDYTGGKLGVDQEISSPWDVALSPCGNILYVAMAGTHQIWAYFIDNCRLWGRDYAKETCFAVIGSGREENRNNRYPRNAGLAQPSGLCFDSANNLYFADSESSSVRRVNFNSGGKVEAVAGGDLDPKNLFAFGDCDGVGYNAKLQHPLSVAYSTTNGMLYVADSYNHKLKKIDPTSKACTTVNNSSDIAFSEPGGLSSFANLIYIADTNNHQIRVFNVDSNDIEQFELSDRAHTDPPQRSKPNMKRVVRINSNGGTLDLSVSVTLPPNSTINQDAPSFWSIISHGEKLQFVDKWTPSCRWSVNVKPKSSVNDIVVTSRVFLCLEDTCSAKEAVFLVEVDYEDGGPTKTSLEMNCSV